MSATSTPEHVSRILDALESCYGTPHRSVPATPIDELVLTILSQHTSDSNTERAFRSLRSRFPTWEWVIDARTSDVADAIRSGGLANLKAPRIQQALRDVYKRVGSFDLAFLADRSVEEARDWLTSLHGVGPKTASCVLLFSLDVPALPVDTHVHRVSLRLGLIPPRTSADRAHGLLEALVPDERTYDAHMLLIHHGRETCVARRPRCSACVLVQWCPSASEHLEVQQEQTGAHDHQTH